MKWYFSHKQGSVSRVVKFKQNHNNILYKANRIRVIISDNCAWDLSLWCQRAHNAIKLLLCEKRLCVVSMQKSPRRQWVKQVCNPLVPLLTGSASHTDNTLCEMKISKEKIPVDMVSCTHVSVAILGFALGVKNSNLCMAPKTIGHGRV